jgi:hypothetical protein
MADAADYWIPAFARLKKSKVKAERCHSVPSPAISACGYGNKRWQARQGELAGEASCGPDFGGFPIFSHARVQE